MFLLNSFCPRISDARMVRIDPRVQGYNTTRFGDAVKLLNTGGSIVSEVNEGAGEGVRDAVGRDVLDTSVGA